jgi:hypothetical protein
MSAAARALTLEQEVEAYEGRDGPSSSHGPGSGPTPAAVDVEVFKQRLHELSVTLSNTLARAEVAEQEVCGRTPAFVPLVSLTCIVFPCPHLVPPSEFTM